MYRYNPAAAHLADKPQAQDARECGLAAEFGVELVNALKRRGSETADVLAMPKLTGLHNWDTFKEKLE